MLVAGSVYLTKVNQVISAFRSTSVSLTASSWQASDSRATPDLVRDFHDAVPNRLASSSSGATRRVRTGRWSKAAARCLSQQVLEVEDG